jgi:hypothetical protein
MSSKENKCRYADYHSEEEEAEESMTTLKKQRRMRGDDNDDDGGSSSSSTDNSLSEEEISCEEEISSRRNPFDDPAPTMGRPRTQRTTPSKTMAGTPPIMAATGATMTVTRTTISSPMRPSIS